MTLEEAIKRIETYGDRVSNVAQQTMKEQVYAGRTNKKSGALGGSIVKEKEGEFMWFVGSYVSYARIINDGRREVRPVNGKWLVWEDVPYAPNIMNKKTGDYGHVFAKRSSAVGPDNFVGRTASFVRSILRSLW